MVKRFLKSVNLSVFDTLTKKTYYYPVSLLGLLNSLYEEILELQEEIKIRRLDNYDKYEIGQINSIYDAHGFDGVVEYSKHKLSDYGIVKEENGLVMMATGGWSEHEEFIWCLNFLTSKMRPHNVGHLGSAFYYSKEKYDPNIEIRKVKQ